MAKNRERLRKIGKRWRKIRKIEKNWRKMEEKDIYSFKR